MKPFEQINLDRYLDERPQEGVLRVDRTIFTDPDIFELEMERIWERTWLYLCHESQVPKPGDFLTTTMGRQPVIVLRGASGQINVFINACSHRGSQLLREERGRRSDITCFFHGWCFDTEGELKSVTREKGGGYPDQFRKENYALTRVARVDAYRGFVFASLSDEVPSLREHLRDATVMIDLLADQAGEQGLEILRGTSTYTYDGNWKLQAENGVDGYHVHGLHVNFALTTQNRERIRAAHEHTKSMDVSQLGNLEAGFFDFGNGHVTLWGDWPNRGDRRPNFHQYDEWTAKFGAVRAHWMIGKLRNTLIYPNVFLMDQMSTQIRVFRPLAVDKTEVTIYAIAPKGERADMRAHRIRQYEDFFNASGMATPDDLSEFRASQAGYQGRLARWNDLSRGIKFLTKGADERAQALGVSPEYCGGKVEDEGIFLAQHRRWLRMMQP
jgi:benzoate/toluate 1,2-dioxygenase subunit alpha